MFWGSSEPRFTATSFYTVRYLDTMTLLSPSYFTFSTDRLLTSSWRRICICLTDVLVLWRFCQRDTSPVRSENFINKNKKIYGFDSPIIILILHLLIAVNQSQILCIWRVNILSKLPFKLAIPSFIMPSASFGQLRETK